MYVKESVVHASELFTDVELSCRFFCEFPGFPSGPGEPLRYRSSASSAGDTPDTWLEESLAQRAGTKIGNIKHAEHLHLHTHMPETIMKCLKTQIAALAHPGAVFLYMQEK